MNEIDLLLLIVVMQGILIAFVFTLLMRLKSTFIQYKALISKTIEELIYSDQDLLFKIQQLYIIVQTPTTSKPSVSSSKPTKPIPINRSHLSLLKNNSNNNSSSND